MELKRLIPIVLISFLCLGAVERIERPQAKELKQVLKNNNVKQILNRDVDAMNSTQLKQHIADLTKILKFLVKDYIGDQHGRK